MDSLRRLSLLVPAAALAFALALARRRLGGAIRSGKGLPRILWCSSPRTILDAGGLALSKDRSTQGRAFDAGYGIVCDLGGALIPDLFVAAASQEVALVTNRSGAAIDLARCPVGRKLRILPNHACFTAAAHGEDHVVDGDTQVVAHWSRINGW
jgi:D-serine deaminase-like pyridoxal phosphate-dependent protein